MVEHEEWPGRKGKSSDQPIQIKSIRRAEKLLWLSDVVIVVGGFDKHM